MKVYKAEVLIIDSNEDLSEESVIQLLEDVDYLYPTVLSMRSVEIGEWDDSNPLNHRDAQAAEVARLFP